MRVCVELGRLFEALVSHKEVIKKNVLPLIVDYVAAEGTSRLNENLRKCLGVSFLLQMVSKFEEQQLLAYLDAIGLKQKWRQVWNSFSSTKYKGQY